ncbi:MAG: hypothetical protein K2Y71_00845 [Xanthobacteraceae bacterium]|nr:hypothetical protein [Xanthobacteraceae bacterium]
MGRKSEEYRAQARQLMERAETAASETIRLTLVDAAQRAGASWPGKSSDPKGVRQATRQQ